MRFVLVDRILELVPGTRVRAARRIDPNDDYFADHFPGHPIVPGVLLVEMIAQAAGKCLMAALPGDKWPVLMQVRQASFRRPVGPGADVVIDAAVESLTPSTASARGTITVDGAVAADATVLFAFIPRGLLTAGYEDEVLAAWRGEQAGV